MKYYDMAFRWGGPFVFTTIVFLVIFLALGGGVPWVPEKVPIILFGTWLAAIVMLSEIDLDKRIAQLLHDFAAIGLWTGGSIILFWLLKEHQGYSLWILACTTGIAYIRLDVKKRVRLWSLLVVAIVLLDAVFALPPIMSHIMLVLYYYQWPTG